MTFTKWKIKDNAETQLQTSITSTATTIVLASGGGAKMPDVPCILTLNARSGQEVIKLEKVKVTEKINDNLKVDRGYGGTTAQSFDAGDYVSCFVTVEPIQDLQDEVTRLETSKKDDFDFADIPLSSLKDGPSETPANNEYLKWNEAEQRYEPGVVEAVDIPEVISFANSDYLAGEAITKGDSLFAETGPTFAEATLVQNIGDVASNKRVSPKQIGSGVAGSTLKLALAKLSSPSANLNIRLETDNAGSPSGTLIDANATASIAPASLIDTGIINDGAGLGGTNADGGRMSSNTWYNVATFTPKYNINNITLGFGAYYGGSGITNCRISGSGIDITLSVVSMGVAIGSSYMFMAGVTYTISLYGNFERYAGGGSSSVSGTNANITRSHTLNGFTSTSNPVETTLTLGGTITIPKGTPYHIVAFAGTYGSETVNGTNYYKIGYSSNDTTTRGSKLWNGTAWGAIRTAYNMYVSTTLSENILLSKTDADFVYKLPDIPRIAKENYAIGQLVKYDFDGVSKALTGLTSGANYFVNNTPGAISATPGTNKVQIGKAIATDKILINKKAINLPITVGTSPFTRQNTTGNSLQYYVSGGTVNPIQISKDGTNYITQSTATGYIGTLAPGDYLKVTYTVLPTITYSEL